MNKDDKSLEQTANSLTTKSKCRLGAVHLWNVQSCQLHLSCYASFASYGSLHLLAPHQGREKEPLGAIHGLPQEVALGGMRMVQHFWTG